MAITMGPIVFVVVVFGGLGSLAGCFIASLIMGLVQTFAVVLDVSFADLLRRVWDHGHLGHAARRGADDPAAPDRRAPALPDADPRAAGQAARAHGHARHMSESLVRAAAPALAAEAARAGCAAQWPWLAALAVALVVPWFSFDWTTGRHSGFIVVDAEPDGHHDHLRAQLQHADGPGRPAVLRPRGVPRAGRLCDRACGQRRQGGRAPAPARADPAGRAGSAGSPSPSSSATSRPSSGPPPSP